ncbi:MAG TPA: CBS domain-containing protein [Hyalangium sp.]|nr:CBS domain-containing protein [Hyalangium sp.]
MADRRMDNGRDEARNAQRSGVPENGTPGILGGGTDVSGRSAEVSPPGSRERSESDVTGWSPERDEDPSLRQGRFHRAAAMRLAQPRTSTDTASGMGTSTGMGMSGMGTGAGLNTRGALGGQEGFGSQRSGPYGHDDRDDRYATGMGGGQLRMGEHDTRHSLELRRDTGGENYRPWDRSGFGAEDRQLGNQGRFGPQGQYGNERYDPMLGMGQASPGQPGMGVNVGQSETFTARGSDTGTSRSGQTGGLLSGMRRRWQREPLTAREIMTRGVKTVRHDSPLREVAQIMKDEDCGVVPIVDERGMLAGIVTDRDLVIRSFTGGKNPDQLRARDVMTDDVECVHPDEDIHSIIALMGKRQIRRIPVVERDDRVIGIISMGDIANRADYDEELQEALDRISSKRSFWSRLT